MAFISDMKVLYHMLVKPVRGDNHAERMESFYGGQAAAYDDFRKRLLKGREELWGAIPRPTEGVWVDMGGGTGANIENLANDIESLKKVYVVDLSESLLKEYHLLSPLLSQSFLFALFKDLVTCLKFSILLSDLFLFM